MSPDPVKNIQGIIILNFYVQYWPKQCEELVLVYSIVIHLQLHSHAQAMY